MSSNTITLNEAAEQLGVHYMTAYRYVRTGRMIAEKRQGKWWVDADDLAAVVAEGTGARRPAAGQGQAPRERLIEPFRARLVAGDTAGCWDLISAALAGGASPVEVHTRFLQGAMREIGESWRRGELSVSDEHRATATASRLLGQMGPLFRHRGRRRGTIVIGTVSGDHHVLPSAMMADLLSDLRFEVIDLGANTPSESFVQAARQSDDLVGIGVCVVVDELLAAALEHLRDIREALPDVFLLAGGPPLAVAGDPEFAMLTNMISTNAREVCESFDQAASALVANK